MDLHFWTPCCVLRDVVRASERSGLPRAQDPKKPCSAGAILLWPRWIGGAWILMFNGLSFRQLISREHQSSRKKVSGLRQDAAPILQATHLREFEGLSNSLQRQTEQLARQSTARSGRQGDVHIVHFMNLMIDGTCVTHVSHTCHMYHTAMSRCEDYDRTVRDLMSRVLGRSDDLDSPHAGPPAPRAPRAPRARSPRRVLEPVTMQ